MAQSNWEPFFAQLSKVVLEYDNLEGQKNRNSFRDKVIQIFDETNTPKPKYGGGSGGNKMLDQYDFIDPFTFFMSISLEQDTKKERRITGNSSAAQKFCEKIKEVFQLDKTIDVPDDFSGLAIPNHDNRTFLWIDDDKEEVYRTKYLDDSWKFFKCILDENCETDALISYCVEFHSECKHVSKTKITDVLHFLVPSKYISLTSDMIDYISNNYKDLMMTGNVDFDNMIKLLKSNNKLKLTDAYSKYFKLCDILKRYTDSLNKSLVQLNAEAVNQSFTNAEASESSKLSNESIYEKKSDDDSDASSTKESNPKTNVSTIKGGQNVICYGIPGCGKSYKINQKIDYETNKEYIERIVFHPDYTYADFVGQILPKVDGTNVSYPFNAGPFTRILKTAKEHPNHKCYLIIEEINRGNAPSIFGDIFQLLDRDENGQSRYAIKNYDIANWVYGNPDHDIKIPGNLSIICTMNTSDQNVFTLDTAFKRRWSQYFIDDNDGKNGQCPFFNDSFTSEGGDKISTITWGVFHDAINKQIAKETSPYSSFEDKRLGTWFVSKDELEIKKFTNKVLRYLWDDVRKTNSDIFKNNIHTFEEIYDDLLDAGNDADEFFKEILDDNLYNTMIAGVNNGN